MRAEMGNKSNSQRLGKICFVSRKSAPKPSSSQKKDSPSTVEDLRSKFYGHYRNEAEDYDREFLEEHDEDLNTTLIFVCSRHRPGTCVLTRITGWSFFPP